jgi:hypothetical protein
VIEDKIITEKTHHYDMTTSDYQILDVRSESIAQINPYHDNAINIPIEQLTSRI